MTTNSSLQFAWQLYQQGRYAEAEQAGRPMLSVAEQAAEAHSLLGAVCLAQGEPRAAIEHLQAAAQQSGAAELHYNLGIAYQAAGQLEAAILAYREAIARHPSFGDAFTNLATVLYSQGRLGESLAAFQDAARVQPDSYEAQFNLGNWYRDQRKFDLAATAYQQSVALNPSFTAGHCHLGYVLMMAERLDEAIAAYRRALQLEPENVEAIHDLGTALQRNRQLDEALDCFGRVLELAPENTTARLNRATILKRQGKMDEGKVAFDRWLAVAPHNANRFCELGKSLQFERRMTEAIEAYQQAIALDPEYAEAHYLLALARLSLGELSGGWPDFEWRLRLQFDGQEYPIPRWQGEDIRSRRILVYTDGGFGDTLQFIRYLPWLEQRAGKVSCRVQGSLTPLLIQSGFRGLGRLEDMFQVPCDTQVAIMSLPGLFGTTLENIPSPGAYLSAEPGLIARWRSELDRWRGLRIGIHWHGARKLWSDQRSMRLSEFEPLARIPGVTLFSLQRNEGSEELAMLDGRFEVVDLASRLDRTGGAFMDTAAVMKILDLVITCDTSIAHLAGGLGVPVWVALRRSADWRWLMDRDDSPWYSSMRLFRQSEWNDWTDVFQRMAAEVAELAAARRT